MTSYKRILQIESFLMNVLSRRFEFQADDFAVNLGKKELLKSALLKLYKVCGEEHGFMMQSLCDFYLINKN